MARGHSPDCARFDQLSLTGAAVANLDTLCFACSDTLTALGIDALEQLVRGGLIAVTLQDITP